MRSRPCAHEGAVHVERGLLGARDEGHVVAHHVLDRRRHQRVVRAAEHERVDVGGLERREVLLGDREELRPARDAGLDELDEPRAGLA